MNGFQVIESPHIPRNKVITIGEQIFTKHIMMFYNEPKEVFIHFDFDIAVKKYCSFVLDNLYTKIENKFKEFPRIGE